MKISVIVPVYNVEKYLKKSIKSIMDSTYKEIDIILINDGSTDSSPKICDEFQKLDSRIIVIHQENKGLSAARNIGIEKSIGDIITFVDSDDIIYSNMFEIMIKNMVEYNGDIVICNYKKIYSISDIMEPLNDDKVEIISNMEALARIHGSNGEMYSVAWGKLFKREVIGDLRFPIGKLNEDEYLTYKILDRAKNVIINNMKMYNYNCGNQNSITHKKNYSFNKDDLNAFLERKVYFENKGYKELAIIAGRTYLDRVQKKYQELPKGKKYLKVRKELLVLYRKVYLKIRKDIHGAGYIVFFISPVLSKILKKFK